MWSLEHDMIGSKNAIDKGTAYGRKPAHSNRLLTEVGPGKPMGELFRRYWQPVATSAQATTRPKQVRVLGEDLILFRDRKGRPGLLYPRCMHRGTTLFYGKVEDEGIRCCYHGWLFGVDGTCLDQPCEPEHGLHRGVARQPWYPVEERYGLVFAYLGPPEQKPILPRYDILERVAPGEQYQQVIGGQGATGDDSFEVLPYSWLHMNDNVLDPFHVQVLHSTFTVVQFAAEFKVMPTCDFVPVEDGVYYSAYRKLDDGREVDRISHWISPNIMSVPSIRMDAGPSTGVSWVVPADDDSYFQVFVQKVREKRPFALAIDGKLWGEKSEQERQAVPGDFEAQFGQGTISLHSEEHLAQSDRGVVMQRRFLEQQVKIVQEGGDPAGVIFDPAHAVIHVRSGNFFRADKREPVPAE
jgi:phenylpropionate dioxygenase-like ring-hydroxylating dioxygenase large terminal subunit